MGILSGLTNVLSLGANRAAKQAGAAQVAGLEAGRADIQKYLKQATKYLSPYRDLGTQTIPGITSLLGIGGNFDPNAITQTPGYQFRLGEGVNAMDRSASAAGLLGTGGYGKALTRYGQDYASNEFNNQYMRLANLLGLGYGAAGQSGNYAMNAGNQLAGISGGIGNAQADSILGNAAANQLAFGNAMRLGSLAFGGMGGGAAGAAGAGIPSSSGLGAGTFYGSGQMPSFSWL